MANEHAEFIKTVSKWISSYTESEIHAQGLRAAAAEIERLERKVEWAIEQAKEKSSKIQGGYSMTYEEKVKRQRMSIDLDVEAWDAANPTPKH